ncbi:hypothetical protein K466DRAFT_606016 [Polyporus arcularius HHB13444]|uniref:Uncharacterized protein n=1 Tax=Polyporus arcularius HHB13444 TaxID=1314778 RepID=A0A5C3NS93_9APHY|nr:hypothetical protein K466DRAFT_606016 [Polyporus arcularius HHB13444]
MQWKHTVRIDDRRRLHTFRQEDPPSTRHGRFDPPPAPLMLPTSLPPTPVLHSGPVPEAGAPLPRSVPGTSSGASAVAYPPYASDLCSTLQKFPWTWPVGQVRYADLRVPGNAVLSGPAFVSRRKSCVLYFWPESRADGWHVRVGPFGDGQPITIHDILSYVDRELWRVVGVGLRRVELFPYHVFLGLQE